MIINRTITDVNEASRIREEVIKRFLTPTDAERQTLERGTLTINTLNRIENEQEAIKTLLNSIGYYNNLIINKSWTTSDYFSSADF